MTYEPNLWGMVNCPQCGKRFMSDCGPDFCDSSCENQYEREHAKCEKCEEEVGEDHLSEDGLCEDCEEKEND